MFDGNWVAYPARKCRGDQQFAPTPANSPVGNAKDFSNHRIHQIWLELFERPASLACHFTNINGRCRFGAQWADIDKKALLQFHCCLLRMALVVRPSIRSYFATDDGDPIIKKIGMSRGQFLHIYTAFCLCDEDAERKSGVGDRSKPALYDGLYKVRRVWNSAILQFQAARNPGRVLLLDEAMQLYTGVFPWRMVLPRKPDPTGAKHDCLCEPNGYLVNAIPATADPLPYDDKRGRVFAVMLALLTSSTLGPLGKSYTGENRCVSVLAITLFNYTIIFLITLSFSNLLHPNFPRSPRIIIILPRKPRTPWPKSEFSPVEPPWRMGGQKCPRK